MGKTFLISEELANQLLDFLDEYPYKQVYTLCEGLLHLKEAPAGVVTEEKKV